MGGKTFKLKFGHRGANHPVKNLVTGKIEITCQNHGFCVDIDTLKDKAVELTHINLNDHTLEGIRCKKVPAFSVQYHPEASPGPHDSSYLFETFIKLMEQHSS
jgi:carbamoyl-phosphate synthase small subunit